MRAGSQMTSEHIPKVFDWVEDVTQCRFSTPNPNKFDSCSRYLCTVVRVKKKQKNKTHFPKVLAERQMHSVVYNNGFKSSVNPQPADEQSGLCYYPSIQRKQCKNLLFRFIHGFLVLINIILFSSCDWN